MRFGPRANGELLFAVFARNSCGLICDPVSELYATGGIHGFTTRWAVSDRFAERGEWTGIEGASWRGGVSGQRIVMFLCRGVRSFDRSGGRFVEFLFLH